MSKFIFEAKKLKDYSKYHMNFTLKLIFLNCKGLFIIRQDNLANNDDILYVRDN